MSTNSIPYVQDTDQWVTYYLDMAEKHTLDPSDGYVTSHGHVLYPVEKKRVIFKEKEVVEKTEDPVTVTMVTPIQQSVNQVKEEVKDLKQDSTQVASDNKVGIKVSEKMKTVIRKRAGGAGRGTVRDQLSRQKYS